MSFAKVQLRIPDHLHAPFVELAKANHRSMNGQIVAMIEDALLKQPNPSRVISAAPTKEKHDV